MAHDEKIAKLEVNVETQSITIAELRGFNERILSELHKGNIENRTHTDEQVEKLRDHTDTQVDKLREHTDRQVAELRKSSEEQRIRHEQQLAEQRRHSDEQIAALRNDMTAGFRWTTGAILTLAGLIVAMYAKLLALY